MSRPRTVAEAQAVLERSLPRCGSRRRNWNRPYRPLDLDGVLAFHHARMVACDRTIKYRWRTLQLLPGPSVEAAERPDGDSALRHHGEPVGACLANRMRHSAANSSAVPATSGSPQAEVPVPPCPAGRPIRRTKERRPSLPSYGAPLPRRLSASSPAGRRSSRLNCKACRSGRPPACPGTLASPRATTSAPTACLGAETAPRHPYRNQQTLTKSLLLDKDWASF